MGRRIIIITTIILSLLIISIMCGILNKRYSELENKFNLLKGNNKWWEMVNRDCGYKNNDKDDYCRGFSDGYDYKNELIYFNNKMEEEINK